MNETREPWRWKDGWLTEVRRMRSVGESLRRKKDEGRGSASGLYLPFGRIYLGKVHREQVLQETHLAESQSIRLGGVKQRRSAVDKSVSRTGWPGPTL